MAKATLSREDRFSVPAIRQQQLAWILYISEGFIANLRNALTVNNFCMYEADIDAVERLIRNNEHALNELRARFFPGD